MEIAGWERELEGEREGKNAFFAGHWQSPIPPEDRKRFKGLDYFPPAPNYRFELELHEHEQKKLVKMVYTQGQEKDFVRWGEFRFKFDDKECKLQVYKSNPKEERLFILFRDATSGKETYGAGRYLDLEPERDLTPDGKWVLDFNKAYNPWCVYSKDYTCPLVPKENCLEVAILAGEKDYSVKKD